MNNDLSKTESLLAELLKESNYKIQTYEKKVSVHHAIFSTKTFATTHDNYMKEIYNNKWRQTDTIKSTNIYPHAKKWRPPADFQ